MGQVEDPRFRAAGEPDTGPRVERVRGDVVRGGAVLPATGRRRGRDGGPDGVAVPHRSRREIQRNLAPPVSNSRRTYAVVQPELAIRFGRSGRRGALLQPALERSEQRVRKYFDSVQRPAGSGPERAGCG